MLPRVNGLALGRVRSVRATANASETRASAVVDGMSDPPPLPSQADVPRVRTWQPPGLPPLPQAPALEIATVAPSTAGEHTGKIVEFNRKRLRVGQYFEIPPPHRNQKGYHVIGCGVRGCNDQTCHERKTYFEEDTMISVMVREHGQVEMTREQKRQVYNAMQKSKFECITYKKRPREDVGASLSGSSSLTSSELPSSGSRGSGATLSTAVVNATPVRCAPASAAASHEGTSDGLFALPREFGTTEEIAKRLGSESLSAMFQAVHTDELAAGLGYPPQLSPAPSVPQGSSDMLEGPIPFAPPSTLPDALSSESHELRISDLLRPSTLTGPPPKDEHKMDES